MVFEHVQTKTCVTCALACYGWHESFWAMPHLLVNMAYCVNQLQHPSSMAYNQEGIPHAYPPCSRDV